MSPTVFNHKGYHFFFFSHEESRIHVHVHCSDGEAKFWLDPVVALAVSEGLNKKQLKDIHKIVEDRQDEIKKSWKKHFRDS